jgi:hypothetical protein
MTPLEDKSVTDLTKFETQIDAEFNTTAARRELIFWFTETSLLFNCLTVFRWHRHNVLITKGIYNYTVYDTVFKRLKKILSQLDPFLFFGYCYIFSLNF